MVRLENIDFGYKKDKLLFNNLNLFAERGSIYGLLGKNGAGKTTLLKIITGIRQVQRGKAIILGHNPFDRSYDLLEQIFFVPEELYLPSCTGNKYVNQYAGFYPNFDKTAFVKNLDSFDIEVDMHLGRMSYGQKKKFLLSFAMASGTKLVLLDEPTNGLDIPSKSVFRKLCSSALSNERTFIISTHQVRDLNILIDSVILIEKGSVILNDRISAISEKFSFITLPRNHSRKDLLYFEEQLEGIKAIVKNNDNNETYVDMELLFNATCDKQFLGIFKNWNTNKLVSNDYANEL